MPSTSPTAVRSTSSSCTPASACRQSQSTVRAPLTIAASGGAAYERLPHLVQRHAGDAVCVPLRAVQSANLASGLAAFVAEVIAQLAETADAAALEALCAQYDASDVSLLDAAFEAFGRTPRIVLALYSIEQFPSAPLNDFLQAVFRWGEGKPLGLVLVYTAPLAVLPRGRMPADLHQSTSWLSALLTARVLHAMDVAPLAFPDKSAFWVRVVCPFFVRPNTALWLGRSIFELVRRRYWHVEPSWESVAQTVRLCYLHHFMTQPLSAFVHTLPTLATLQRHWTPEMADALRLALVAPYVAKNSAPPSSVLQLTHDTPTLLDALPSLRAEVHTAAGPRIVMLAAVQSLLEHTGMADMHGTRLSYSACIATSLELPVPYTDWNPARGAAYAHTRTTPSAGQLRAFLEHLAGTVPGAEVGALLARLQRELTAQAAHLDAPLAATIAASCAALHKLAQGRTETLSAAFCAWLTESWTAMLDAPLNGLGAAIWTYDFADPISAALEGAARAGVLLALDAPSETLASMVAASTAASGQRLADPAGAWPERAMGVSDLDELRATLAETDKAQVPDVCRLYALYKDSGKFINLADWYDAFVYSLEADAREHATPWEADPAQTQVRFALAINELAYLGLLGPTGRKVEHLCRTVWDLPIDGVPEDG